MFIFKKSLFENSKCLSVNILFYCCIQYEFCFGYNVLLNMETESPSYKIYEIYDVSIFFLVYSYHILVF